MSVLFDRTLVNSSELDYSSEHRLKKWMLIQIKAVKQMCDG